MRPTTGRNWTRRSIEELCAQFLKAHGGGGDTGYAHLISLFCEKIANNIVSIQLSYDYASIYKPIMILSVLGTATYKTEGDEMYIASISGVDTTGLTGSNGWFPSSMTPSAVEHHNSNFLRADNSLKEGVYHTEPPFMFPRSKTGSSDTPSDTDANGLYLKCGTCDFEHDDVNLQWYKVPFADLNAAIDPSYVKLYNATNANGMTISKDADCDNFWNAFHTFIPQYLTDNNLGDCIEFCIVSHMPTDFSGYWSDGLRRGYKKIDGSFLQKIRNKDLNNYILVGGT